MKTFDMMHLNGVLAVETLLTLLSEAKDLGEEALANLQYDGLSPDEYQAAREERQIFISTLHVVSERIREKMEMVEKAEARWWLERFCARNLLDVDGLSQMASDLARGEEYGDIGNKGGWSRKGSNAEEVDLFPRGKPAYGVKDCKGAIDFVPDEFWVHLKTLTGIDPFPGTPVRDATASE